MAILFASVITGFSFPTQVLLRTIAAPSFKFNESVQVDLFANYSNEVSQGYFQDYLSNFARFFGFNAKQDANYLYIQKNDLAELTPLENNTAESLLAAAILYVMQHESNSLISNIVISYWNTEFLIKSNSIRYQTIQFLIHLYPETIDSGLSEIEMNRQISSSWF
ncbi:hypothetical protein IQ230_14005 [Gloeocapsopsis crepidinum LEGE 06123]|uniref:DUF1400 domain-containing protein n=1 Tax=Gloeocapsopsis crepidinum LEGE 06123 TaxID=588587 RepID=A0ABR9UT44_9CHRO|nr:hypothetical protein [Gloeocapsopsis crepidinum]MBE9191441.1 hypothetical protein [Gloeocapsopsis crepidinum LEGE 06123]